MVGQAQPLSSTLSFFSKNKKDSLNVRELIVLTTGLAEDPLTMNQVYTFTKNMSVRIKSRVEFDVPEYDIFESILHKLTKQGIFEKYYSLEKKKYVLQLTDKGEGKFDYLLFSIKDQSLVPIFEEFQNLINLSM